MKEMKVREHGGWTSYTYRNKTKKPLTVALSGAGRIVGEDSEGNLINEQ
jgi:hypothetical protein